MVWLPVVILVGFTVVLTVSMIRGGRLGTRWYTGGRSWAENDALNRPVEPTDNVRSPQWGGTTHED